MVCGQFSKYLHHMRDILKRFVSNLGNQQMSGHYLEVSILTNIRQSVLQIEPLTNDHVLPDEFNKSAGSF